MPASAPVARKAVKPLRSAEIPSARSPILAFHRELVALFDEKLTASEMGRRIGLTKNTIIGRLNRCGLRRRGEYLGPTSMDRLNELNAAWAERNGTVEYLIVSSPLHKAWNLVRDETETKAKIN
jgi:hypothetical protein